MAKQPSEADYKRQLTPQQYAVLRQKATEPPFTGDLLNNVQTGMYSCAACGAPLFSSEHKFDSGHGWPDFYQAVDDQAIVLTPDDSHGMHRTEATCANCGSHLGHLFDGVSQVPTGQDFCINSAALKFIKKA